MATTAALPAIWWGFFDTLGADRGGVHEADRTLHSFRSRRGVAGTGIAVGNLAHEADAHVLENSLRWLVCRMVALCYVAHPIVHIAYAKAGRGGWLVAARKIPTIAAALLLGALGSGLSTVAVAGVLASAAGAQVLWNIWERAYAGARNGDDPGPGLARVHRPA